MDKDIKDTINYKGAQIKKAMDVKAEGIFISGSARDATLMVTTFYQGLIKTSVKGKDWPEDVVLENKWKQWQKFFYDQMTGQMPIEPECATCGGKMKLSQKGDWYCPGFYDKANLKHHPLPNPNDQQFLNNLPV